MSLIRMETDARRIDPMWPKLWKVETSTYVMQ